MSRDRRISCPKIKKGGIRSMNDHDEYKSPEVTQSDRILARILAVEVDELFATVNGPDRSITTLATTGFKGEDEN
jgi:hypothetical protein